MEKQYTQQVNLPIVIGVIGLSFFALILMSLSSFRLGVNNLEFAWQVNLSRVSVAAAGGLAFAAIGGLIESRRNALIQIFGFNIVTIVSSLVLGGVILDWPLALIIVLALLGTWGMVLLTKLATREHLSANLVLSLVLGLSLILSMLNFIGASTLNETAGSIMLWLQGDLYAVGIYSAWCLPLAALLFAWLLFTSARELPACLLFGLGLGATGPIFFIPLLVPIMIRKLTNLEQGRLFLASCGISGAMFVVLADMLPRLLLGGYAPTLTVPIALISIPILLWWNRLQTLAVYPSTTRGMIEALLVLLWVGLTIFVFYHVVAFANLLT